MIEFEKPDVEQFFQTLGIQTFAVSPDEKQMVFSTNLNGTYNLWAMDLPHTFPYPLSFENQSCQEVFYDKNGSFIVAVMDKDGDENGQIYALPTSGGKVKPLREAEGYRHDMPFLSDDGKCLYYTSNKENETFLNAYSYHLETGKEESVLEGKDAMVFLFDKSPEEKSFLYGEFHRNTYSLPYVKMAEEHILLTPDKEIEHTFDGAVYTSETDVYLVTNYGEDFTYLAKFDIEARSFEKVLQLEKESFTEIVFDRSSESLYLTSEKGVQDYFYRYRIQSGELEKIETPVNVIEKVIVGEKGGVYLKGSSPRVPSNIYKRSDQGWARLTNYNVPGVAEEDMVEPYVVTYSSFDGLEIEAQFFKAKEENNNGHVIVWPHGGPQVAERASFRSLFQFLLHRGYSIFAPNFRGSTGYGLAFKRMVEGDWGNGPRLDNVHGMEWLINEGHADRDKILLMGGSYGGYMALLLHGRHPDYFKAVVDIFGPSNLFSFLDTVPEHWKPATKKLVGDPIKDKDELTEASPDTYLSSMTKPMLVIQGAMDPRVVKEESDQIVDALKQKGRKVDYLVLDDEGHGFSKKENEMTVYRKVLAFFDQCL
ncbi:S9 family peptidase [Guptibacillus algicola]|uniref:S9 family peptidase n=1 Tax=Guptibacillus algicola TaxID=225844 RepID=UPI001CD70DA2|nr:S9 family peptidase [Alkalihalobacillus algicola]MCA0986983.1 S9 family peptidase [Alkalihalobacillus algicola]